MGVMSTRARPQAVGRTSRNAAALRRGKRVETVRQRVPSNAVDIVNLLVGRGADVNARACMYGGWHTPLPLLTSGLMEALVEVLAKHGANEE